MKYEEIEVGESYEYGLSIEKVISKNDEYKAVITVDEDGDVFALNEDELIHFKPIKKELPETGVLVCNNGVIAYRLEGQKGFGFDENHFENSEYWSFESNPKHWRTATPEEESKFNKMLEAEAEKRGLGVDSKIKGHADGDHEEFNENQYIPHFALTEAWNKNGQIFLDGIWAEPMSAEPKTFMAKNCNNYWVETYSKLMAGNFMIRGDFSLRMDFAKKAPQEGNTKERIKQLDGRINRLEKEIKSLITCFNIITKCRDKEPEKKKAWWRN